PMSDVQIDSGRPGKMRLATIESLDGRTLAARDVHRMLRAWQRELGRKPTAIETAAMQRAAMWEVIASDLRVRLLRGDPDVTGNESTRADNCARRAAFDLAVIMRRRDHAAW